MSKNASRLRERNNRQSMLEAADEADFDIRGYGQNMAALAADARIEGRPARGPFTVYVSAVGVEKLVNDAKAKFVEVTGATLPWNLDCRSGGDFGGTGINYGFGGLGRWGRKMRIDEATEVVGQWARFAGWLRAASECDALARMIKKTQGRGQGSKDTKFDLWTMAARWPSPGKLERMVRAVRYRGNSILSAYAGTPRVSYKGIALGLLSERTVGKAAVVAVAVTLGLGARNYRAARAALIDLHVNYSVVRKDDGVTTRIGNEPEVVENGVAVYAAKFAWDRRISLSRSGWLLVAGSRTYHVEHHEYSFVSITEALVEAREAWEQQDQEAAQAERYRREEEDREMARVEYRAQLASFLDGSELGFSPLITREDSYEAGNCRPGTEQWVMERGWRAKEFVPGPALIPFLDDERVRRVVVAARRRRTEQLDSIAA